MTGSRCRRLRDRDGRRCLRPLLVGGVSLVHPARRNPSEEPRTAITMKCCAKGGCVAQLVAQPSAEDRADVEYQGEVHGRSEAVARNSHQLGQPRAECVGHKQARDKPTQIMTVLGCARREQLAREGRSGLVLRRHDEDLAPRSR